MTKAIFPGSFDPFTNGHLNIVERTRLIFDEVIIVVAQNNQKNNWLSVTTRVRLIENSVKHLNNVSVISTDGLIVDLSSKLEVSVIVRGVRNINDFDAEQSLATFNRQLNCDVETLLVPTAPEFEALSSSRVRELYKFNRPLDDYVPMPIVNFLNEKD